MNADDMQQDARLLAMYLLSGPGSNCWVLRQVETLVSLEIAANYMVVLDEHKKARHTFWGPQTLVNIKEKVDFDMIWVCPNTTNWPSKNLTGVPRIMATIMFVSDRGAVEGLRFFDNDTMEFVG